MDGIVDDIMNIYLRYLVILCSSHWADTGHLLYCDVVHTGQTLRFNKDIGTILCAGNVQKKQERLMKKCTHNT